MYKQLLKLVTRKVLVCYTRKFPYVCFCGNSFCAPLASYNTERDQAAFYVLPWRPSQLCIFSPVRKWADLPDKTSFLATISRDCCSARDYCSHTVQLNNSYSPLSVCARPTGSSIDFLRKHLIRKCCQIFKLHNVCIQGGNKRVGLGIEHSFKNRQGRGRGPLLFLAYRTATSTFKTKSPLFNSHS